MNIKELLKALATTKQQPLLIVIAKADLRYMHDGTSPTPATGHILKPGDAVALFAVEAVNQLRFAIDDKGVDREGEVR